MVNTWALDSRDLGLNPGSITSQEVWPQASASPLLNLQKGQ